MLERALGIDELLAATWSEMGVGAPDAHCAGPPLQSSVGDRPGGG